MNSSQVVTNAVKRLQVDGLLGRAEYVGRKNSLFSCPFRANHGGKVKQFTPSFSVNNDSGAWICFNKACGQKGRTIHQLYAKLTGKGVQESEMELGVAQVDTKDLRARLKAGMPTEPYPMSEYPHVVSIEVNERARAYVRGRRIPDEVVQKLGMAYAPKEVNTGVVRDRIIFPLSWQGKNVGFSARAIADNVPTKLYRPVENVGLMFYDPLGLLDHAEYCGPVWLVEGEFDTAACVREHIPVLGCFHAQVGHDRSHFLQKFSDVTLAFDGDDPGRSGVLSAVRDEHLDELLYGRLRIEYLPEKLDPAKLPLGFGTAWMQSYERGEGYVQSQLGSSRCQWPKKPMPSYRIPTKKVLR